MRDQRVGEIGSRARVITRSALGPRVTVENLNLAHESIPIKIWLVFGSHWDIDCADLYQLFHRPTVGD